MSHKSEFINIIKERGFLHQATDLNALDELMANEKITAYSGFDCTGASLHIGHLIPIMIVRWLQKCGHKPIVLMGGGTTKIGDPSGKDETRKILSDEDINANMTGIKQVFRNFIKFADEGGNAIMVNNDDWLKNLNMIEFLRDYGKHFSVNRMLSMDSVKLRIEREQELSFLEFNYMIMQAYDFVELKNKFNCRLQIAGSDQWGNTVSGIELHRRVMAEKNKGKQNIFDEIFGLTAPLITTSSGAKMGKTASGAVWLNADMLSPYDYWQFWRNTEDADVGRFLRFFTELSIAEIEEIEKGNINEAKKILADKATELCHGKPAAIEARETARKVFEEGGASDNLPTFLIEKSVLENGIAAYELFHLVGLKDSKGEAKKLIEGGGGRINDEKITDFKMLVNLANMNGDYIKLSAGKKQHLLVKVK